VKGEWPHLEKITGPGELDAEQDRVRAEYNGVRLHAAIGYVTPGDEHEGRGDAIRQQRRDGLARGTAGTNRLPSEHAPQGEPVTTSRLWLGISVPAWLKESDTPQ
jgi:hypothetical protein